MNIKRIRKEILSSVMSLLLCGSMLIGSTLAWFTDTAVNSGNIIKSGNLDVKFEYADGTKAPATSTWNDVSTSNQSIFGDQDWEPGYIDAKHVKISNVGSLALEYQVNLVTKGEVDQLAEVIDVYVFDELTAITDRSQLKDDNRVATLKEVLTGVKKISSKTLLEKNENAFTIALKMSEEAGNMYQGMSIGDNFDIQVVARQYQDESDSLGNDYDANAKYPSIDGEIIESGLYYNDETKTYSVTSAQGLKALNDKMLSAKIQDKIRNKDAIIKLESDIDFKGYTWKMVDVHQDSGNIFKEIDGNGHTISNMEVEGQAMFSRIACSNDVTIKNITFDNAKVSSNTLNVSLITGQTYSNILLDNVDVKNSSFTGTYKVAPLIATVYNESDSTITATIKNCDVYNCEVKSTQYDFSTTGMVAFVHAGDNDKIVFENSTVTNVKLYANSGVYNAHAYVYTEGSDTLYNKADGVTVTNCTFTQLSK